jgi:hypothetical protein
MTALQNVYQNFAETQNQLDQLVQQLRTWKKISNLLLGGPILFAAAAISPPFILSISAFKVCAFIGIGCAVGSARADLQAKDEAIFLTTLYSSTSHQRTEPVKALFVRSLTGPVTNKQTRNDLAEKLAIANEVLANPPPRRGSTKLRGSAN